MNNVTYPSVPSNRNIVPMPSPRLRSPRNTSAHLTFDQCPKCHRWCTALYRHAWRRHNLTRVKLLELLVKGMVA